MKFLLGKKLNMTRLFQEDSVVPVTAIAAGPCYVTDIKTTERDGYSAVQIGFGERKKITKALSGHLKGKKFRYLREFRVDDTTITTGAKIDVSTFAVGDLVKVVSKSKGKGFQGVVKRHGFHGSPASHGHKDQLRMPGSIGATDAARVFKGLRMGGHMGDAQVTVANLKVIEIDTVNNILFLKGAVPGARGAFVTLQAVGDLVLANDVAIKPVVESETEIKTEASTTESEIKTEKEDKPEDQSIEEKKSAKDTEDKAENKLENKKEANK